MLVRRIVSVMSESYTDTLLAALEGLVTKADSEQEDRREALSALANECTASEHEHEPGEACAQEPAVKRTRITGPDVGSTPRITQNQIRNAVRKLHVNLGHASVRDMIRILKHGNATPEAIMTARGFVKFAMLLVDPHQRTQPR